MDEREDICRFSAAGLSASQIASQLGRDPSTIYRELRRNGSVAARYSPTRAHAGYRRRRRNSKKPRRIEIGSPLHSRILSFLRATWSPEQIAARLRKEWPRDRSMHTGFKTIYRLLDRDRAAGGRLYLHLRHKGGYHRKHYRHGPDWRGQVPDRRPLAERPAIANRRGRLGDFESDTVLVGRFAAIATHVDRKSRLLVAAPIKDGRADTFNRATIQAMRRFGQGSCRTLTADNGKEFFRFKVIEAALGVRIYFAPPYQSWQRGTNENTNGLLREFFPKTSRERPTRKQIDRAAALINNRPRKCLNWRTPVEVHFGIRVFH